MAKQFNCFDDISAVAGLKKSDKLLFIGGNALFPFVKKFVSTVNIVKKTNELTRLSSSGKQFEKIFIARENVLGEELVLCAARLSKKAENTKDTEGLICFFSEEEVLRAAFIEIVEKHYPTANTWIFDSNVGSVVITDAKGNPNGTIHEN